MTNTEPNPIELVRERLDGGRKWHKGSLTNGQNTCLIGACYDVEDELGDGIRGIYSILASVVVEQYRDRVRPETLMQSDVSPIPEFNDHPKTTFNDVGTVLDKASIKWDEQVR